MIEISTEFDFSHIHVTKLLTFSKNRATEHSKQAHRPCFGLALKISGVSRYTADTKCFTFKPGQVLLLPQGSGYEIVREEYGEYLIADFELDGDTSRLDKRLHLFTLINQAEMTRLFSEAERIWTFKKSAYYSRSMSMLYRIFAELEREYGGYYLEGPRRELIREAGKYLEAHISDPGLSTRVLAEVAGLSESYFRKLFTSVYKYSPGQYISMVRIEKAKELLSSGEFKISEIAEQTGFSSIYYFSAAFKRAVGTSPSEYTGMLGAASMQ